MTTEELRDNIVEYLEINRHIDVDGNIKIKESEKTVIKALIEQAKSEWCRKQRENCAEEVIYPFKKASILNAPEP
jgi:5S rRNA maturation endonuclease (ribonuclease M5)